MKDTRNAKPVWTARAAGCMAISFCLACAPFCAYASDNSLVAGHIQGGNASTSDDASAETQEKDPETDNFEIKLTEAERETLLSGVQSFATERAFTVWSSIPKVTSPRVSKRSDPAVITAEKLTASPVGPTVPMIVAPNPTTEEFIAAMCEEARAIGQERGLYASVMIAQAILESGSGSSTLSKPPNNNLFGIKGSYKGQSAYMLTSEDDGSGSKFDIMSSFRRYPSVRESLEDYADLLTRDMADFYAPAWKANAKTYVEACDYLQGHYATDTSYSSKLQGLILAYDLTDYDSPASTSAANAKDAKDPKESKDKSASKKSAPKTDKDASKSKSSKKGTSYRALPANSASAASVSPEAEAKPIEESAQGVDEEQVAAPASDENVPANPLERREVQGGIAVSVVGGAALALIAKGKIAAAALSAFSMLNHR